MVYLPLRPWPRALFYPGTYALRIVTPCRVKLEEVLEHIETAEAAVSRLQRPSDGLSGAETVVVTDPSAAAALAWLESLSEEGR